MTNEPTNIAYCIDRCTVQHETMQILGKLITGLPDTESEKVLPL
jgi:hypothetical protein